MRGRAWIGAAGVAACLMLTSCGRDATESVTTDTLPSASSAALDCATSMESTLDQGRAIVFMNPGAAGTQTESVRSMLTSDPLVANLTYISQDDAFTEFRALFNDSPELMEGVKATLLPASFRFKFVGPTSPPTSTNDPLARYRSASGVKQVVTSAEAPKCSNTAPAILKAAQRMIDNRFGDNSLIVFMDPQADENLARMKDILLAIPTIKGIVYLSKDDALTEFDCLFKDDPKMIASITKEILPSSFRINVGTDATVISDLATELKQHPGVKTVIQRMTPQQLLAASGSIPTADNGAEQNPNCPVSGTRLK